MTTEAKAAARPDTGVRKVLVVEDDADAARVVVLTLLHPRISAEISPDGADALAKARRLKPDLIVLDVNLPEIDGFEVFRALRSEGALARTRVILVSGQAQRGAFSLAADLGAFACIRKPFMPNVLRDASLRALDLAEQPSFTPQVRRPFRVAVLSADHAVHDSVRRALPGAAPEPAITSHFPSGMAAYRSFAAERPDLAIIDLQLADLDGLSLLKLMRGNPELQSVPTVLVTLSTNWNMVAIALDAGVDHFLLKPLAADAVAKTLRDAYRAWEAREPGTA